MPSLGLYSDAGQNGGTDVTGRLLTELDVEKQWQWIVSFLAYVYSREGKGADAMSCFDDDSVREATRSPE